MKLQKMTTFILEQSEKINDPEILVRVLVKYAMFLERPLTLGMFVPCDEDGNVLEEPHPEKYFDINKPSDKFTNEDKKGLDLYSSALMFYDAAKKNVLFSDLEIEKRLGSIHVLRYGNTVFFSNWKNISVDQIVKHRIEFTESAIKYLGL